MPEEELNLFEFAASNVTETGASPSEIVRRNLVNADGFRRVPNHVPDNLFRQAVSPDARCCSLCSRLKHQENVYVA